MYQYYKAPWCLAVGYLAYSYEQDITGFCLHEIFFNWELINPGQNFISFTFLFFKLVIIESILIPGGISSTLDVLC